MNKREAFLNPSRVADYTGLSLDFINNLIEEGELDKVEIDGAVRVRMSEVDRWLDEEVKPKELINMASELQEEVDVDKIAETLKMDEQEVKKSLNRSDH